MYNALTPRFGIVVLAQSSHGWRKSAASAKSCDPGKQEVFYAGVYFDGKRMFVHGDKYLYCIEAK
jgi:hypothetical protein